MRIPSGSADRYIYFVAVDSTDLKTRETGLSSFTVYRSRNGEAAVAYTTPTINETDSTNMPGVYELLLDEDTTLDAGNDTEEYCVHITQASMAPVTRVIELYRPDTTEGETILTEVIESQGSITLKQALQILIAALAGVTTSSGLVLKTPNGSATRITMTIDAANNERDTSTLNFS